MYVKRFKAFIRIFRPELPFSAGVCVLMGGLIALGRFLPIRESILGFLSVFLISGSALVLNDVFDLEVDRVNAPERPLPSGDLSPREAIGLTVAAIVLGLGTALAISIPALLLCMLACANGILYNWKFKEAGLAGNLMVASSVAMTLVYGGVVAGEPWNLFVWTFALVAFLFDLAEEIAGDAMDMAGDARRRSNSIALVRGRRYALRISASLFGLVILVSFVPFLLGWLEMGYLLLILIMDAAIILFTRRLLESETPEEGRRSMRALYLSALIGMLAFIASQVFG